MHRRDFIKGCSAACVAVAGGGMASLFSACAKMPVVKTFVENKTITLALSSLTESQYHVIRTKQLQYDLLLARLSDGTYRCIYMQCTHQDFPVRFSGSQFVCNQHGSTFDLEGNVKKEPANQPLKKYPVSVVGENVVITI